MPTTTPVATIGAVPPTAEPTRRRSTPLPRRDENRLRQQTRAIRLGERAFSERGDLLVELRDQGVSFDSLAAACGVSREAVRKAVMRRTSGYPADDADD